ncbi:ribonuclease H-like domain-containing protein [Tanacetum coccineum]
MIRFFICLFIMAIGDAPGSNNNDLINNLDASNPLHVQNSDNSSDVLIPFKLQDLQETYDKVDRSVVYNLLQKINTIKQVQCTCDATKELVVHQQLMKLMQFLMRLDGCYHPVRSALLTRDPLLDVKDAYNTISRDESHRGIPESSGVSETKINATSFVVKSFNNNKRNFNNNNNTKGFTSNVSNNRGPNPNLNCKNYGKIRHTVDRCYEIIRFPPVFKKFGNNANNVKQSFNANMDVKCDKQPSASTSFGFTPEQMKKLLSLISDIGSGNFHANMAGRCSFFNGNVWFNMNFCKFFCANNKFVVDVSSLNITVGHPNGTLATISHIGNLKLTNNVVLYDVLVVPGYCKVLGTGSESGGLYLFDMPLKGSLGESNMVLSFHVSKLLWHNRLGHPVDQVLATLHNDLKISKTGYVPVCEVCHRAKQTRESFPLSDHKSKNPGELVHFDLWGPYRVTSKEGYKYFLTIVDDFSRAVWVYLIKSKDETAIICSKCDSESDHLSFFDNLRPQSPNDEGRTSSVEDGSRPLHRHRFTDTTNLYQKKVSATIFVIKVYLRAIQIILTCSNVKYSFKKYVSYAQLNRSNYYFATTLNKSVEPTSYIEALKDNNWVEAMNNEIEALNKNNTWSICVLPPGRKPIGCKWLFKIKYKASGDIERLGLWQKVLVREKVLTMMKPLVLWLKWLLLDA